MADRGRAAQYDRGIGIDSRSYRREYGNLCRLDARRCSRLTCGNAWRYASVVYYHFAYLRGDPQFPQIQGRSGVSLWCSSLRGDAHSRNGSHDGAQHTVEFHDSHGRIFPRRQRNYHTCNFGCCRSCFQENKEEKALADTDDTHLGRAWNVTLFDINYNVD